MTTSPGLSLSIFTFLICLLSLKHFSDTFIRCFIIQIMSRQTSLLHQCSHILNTDTSNKNSMGNKFWRTFYVQKHATCGTRFVFSSQQCHSRRFTVGCRIKPRGTGNCDASLGTGQRRLGRGDAPLISGSEWNLITDGCQRSKHALLHQTCQLRFEFLLLNSMTLQHSRDVYLFHSSNQERRGSREHADIRKCVF